MSTGVISYFSPIKAKLSPFLISCLMISDSSNSESLEGLSLTGLGLGSSISSVWKEPASNLLLLLSETSENAVVIKTAALTPNRARWMRGNLSPLTANRKATYPLKITLLNARIFLRRDVATDISNSEARCVFTIIQVKLINHYSGSRAPCQGVYLGIHLVWEISYDPDPMIGI